MKFENFEKQYESVFTSDRSLRKCDIDLVTTDIGWTAEAYALTMRKFLQESQKADYQRLVKLAWLIRRYCYRGVRRKKTGGNGWELDGSFGVFVKRLVGYDPNFFWVHYGNMLLTYFDEFYPHFDSGNPFEEEYEYPFEYLTLESLILVYKMPERMELLKIGEERKMRTAEFYDYVINYICCYNAKHGDTYKFVFSKWTPRYIKILKKENEGSKI